jgi:RNA polymerase sigma-70 factor, ECF subfamily
LLNAATEEELMRAYAGGDEAAFAELFARLAPVVARSIARRVEQREDVLELVQQTFLHLHRARRRFDPERPLRPWVFTIAFNAVRQHLRGRRRQKPRELALAYLTDRPELRDESPALEREQDAERVRHAMRSLRETQRKVIELHWFEGRSFDQIAAMLDLRVSAAKVRAHRGYRALRAALDKSAEKPIRAVS